MHGLLSETKVLVSSKAYPTAYHGVESRSQVFPARCLGSIRLARRIASVERVLTNKRARPTSAGLAHEPRRHGQDPWSAEHASPRSAPLKVDRLTRSPRANYSRDRPLDCEMQSTLRWSYSRVSGMPASRRWERTGPGDRYSRSTSAVRSTMEHDDEKTT